MSEALKTQHELDEIEVRKSILPDLTQMMREAREKGWVTESFEYGPKREFHLKPPSI